MNWKLSVYGFLAKNFIDEVNNSITTNNTEIKAKFAILTHEDIVKIATAIKNSRTLFTADITDSITGGIIVTFKKR
jgi:hypothetical protein